MCLMLYIATSVPLDERALPRRKERWRPDPAILLLDLLAAAVGSLLGGMYGGVEGACVGAAIGWVAVWALLFGLGG